MNAVLVTGGTGQIGVFLLPRLLQGGCRVIALSRRVAPGGTFRPPGAGNRLTWMHPDTFMSARSNPVIGGQFVESFVSAGPISLAPRLLAYCTGIRRVVCFSSSSVLTKADSPIAAERETIQSMLAAEASLKRTCGERSIALWLLRPTLIYGCGLDRNISRIAGLATRFRVVPVAGRAAGRRQPVHADDLAALAESALNEEAGDGIESAVGGGDTLTYREMVERVFTGLGKRPGVLPVPPVLLAGAARLAGWLTGTDSLNAAVVLRQGRDLVFDDSAVRERLGFDPRPFRPGAADFSIPPSARALQPR